jgi:ribosomal protein L37AE/L43A
MKKIRSIKMDNHVKPDRELEEYECPECGRDCGDLGRHAFDDVTVLWYFTCEHCGIHFGGDL